MGSKRTRRLRAVETAPDALGWCGTKDADRFFNIEDDSEASYPSYAGAITRLPGVKPWWNPLTCIWLHHTKGVPLPHPAHGDADALAFVLKLHNEWKRRKGET